MFKKLKPERSELTDRVIELNKKYIGFGDYRNRISSLDFDTEFTKGIYYLPSDKSEFGIACSFVVRPVRTHKFNFLLTLNPDRYPGINPKHVMTRFCFDPDCVEYVSEIICTVIDNDCGDFRPYLYQIPMRTTHEHNDYVLLFIESNPFINNALFGMTYAELMVYLF